MSIPIILVNLVSAVALWLVLVALGTRIRRLLKLPSSPYLRWPVDLALGAWGAGTTLLVVALAGGLSTLTVIVLFAMWAACGAWRRSWRPLTPLLIGAAGGALFLPVAIGPPFFYDAMVYHLALPWQAMIEGGLHAHPENLFSAFPPLAQLLAMPPLAIGLFRVPATLHWLAWITVAVAVHGLARSHRAPTGTARLAAFAVGVLPIAPLVPGFPAAEAWLLVGLIPAVAMAMAPAKPGSHALAGLLAGISTASRLQGLPWSALVLLLVGIRSRGRLRPTAVAAGCWIVGALPWWFKNLVLLKDPAAPVHWRREGIETLWRDSRSLLKAGASLPDILMNLPRLLAPELEWLLPLLLVAALAVAARKRNIALAGAGLFGLVVWAATGALPRFLAPTVCILVALAAGARESRLAKMMAAATILWCIAVGAARGVAWVDRIGAARLVTHDFRSAGALASPNDPMNAFNDADSLPPDARLLFIAEPRSFSFPRPVTAPSQHDLSPILPLIESSASSEEIAATIRTWGYTHLLVNWRELQRLGSRYPVAPWRSPQGRERWQKLIRSFGPPVVDRDGVQIFEVRR